ncbi:MAD3 protein, partial [Herpetotheres cachinnans]|nr:MAD3 protein [Herpetotheres cachinnans]
MEPAATSIQVLLRAAEFLERRERGAGAARYPPCLAEAEHGYASLCPSRARRAGGSVRSVHNALEKHRYRGGGREAAGQGVTMPELRAQRAKDRLRNRQQSLQRRLQRLLSPTSGERARADSLDSSQLSEPSEGEDAEIEVDGVVFSGDLLPGFSTGRDHSYSSPHGPSS